MAQLRFKGFSAGSSVPLTDVTVGADSGSLTVSSFKLPAVYTGLPRIVGQSVNDTFSLDETGLTGITARQWSVVGGASLGTAATQDVSAQGGNWVQCVVTCDQGVLTTPAKMVYTATMHLTDDLAVVDLCKHDDATRIAVADGDWSSTATWGGGVVPKDGSRVLIPYGRTVTYDINDQGIRLDWVRVDGTLNWALDQSTFMLVEHLIGSRGSTITIGTSNGNRLPAAYTAEVVISDRDYRTNALEPTDMNFTRDPRLWGRGLVSQGVVRLWGNHKRSWSYAEPIAAGATSLVLRDTPTGWEIGDEIIIGGTAVGYTGNNNDLVKQDEYRTLTGVNTETKTVTWTGALSNAHNQQNTDSTRADLYPVVALRKGRNITIRSESTFPYWRRGHVAVMHHMGTLDFWDAQFLDLGRTWKGAPSGVIEENQTGNVDPTREGKFKTNWGVPGGVAPFATRWSTLDARSNMQGRYSIHAHMMGFGHGGTRCTAESNYIEGNPGWAVVHHDCEAFFNKNVMHLFIGAGMVSESGNETGDWLDNLAIGTSISAADRDIHLYPFAIWSNPKNLAGISGTGGDDARFGYGYAFRSREIRSNRNVACSCTWGHVFFHRTGSDANMLAFPKALLRTNIPFKEAGAVTLQGTNQGEFSFVHAPIRGFNDNEAIACYGGGFISKSNAQQFHDINVHIKRFKSWGYNGVGFSIEYIGKYLVEDIDCLPGPLTAGLTRGLEVGGATYQVYAKNIRAEDCSDNAIIFAGATDTLGSSHDAHDETLNPRYASVGLDAVNCGGAPSFIEYTVPATAAKTGPDVTYIRDDLDGTLLSNSANPSDDFPLELAIWNGSTDISTLITNSGGNKSDQMTANGGGTSILALTHHNDRAMPWSNSILGAYLTANGYWTYSGNNVLVYPDIISDRLTARPFKRIKMIRLTGSVAAYTNNGAFTYAGTAVVQADKIAGVAVDGSVVVDAITGATGAGGGGTYALDAEYIPPDHGRVSLNTGTGEVTYTPDKGYSGSDEMYVFVRSQGRYATVRLSFIINDGNTTAPTAPAVTTNFTVADHADANTFGVTLGTRPDTHGRRIRVVQYSTDAGATWRRLCNGWIQAVHKVTVESDGTAIANGSYNVRLRYLHDVEYSASGASADAAVTVT